jgi:hypothetical protein
VILKRFSRSFQFVLFYFGPFFVWLGQEMSNWVAADSP